MVIQDQQETGDFEYMRNSCVIYDSWKEMIVSLPDEMAGELIKMILTYGIDGEQYPTENLALAAMFNMISKKLDEDKAKYDAQVERARNNSKRSHAEVGTKSVRSQSDIKGDTVTVTVTESVTDTDIVNGTESVKETKDNMSVSEIIDYLNHKLGTKYKKGKTTTSMIKARLDEGYTVDDFKTVIDKKVKAWANDPKMSQYLRPETLFRPSHFESYLNEIETVGSRSSPKSDMTAEKYAKIHNYTERKIDYDALGAQFVNV